MLLKSITIENIRSIKSLTLAFPPATMLFFGDIGCGKSSVLKASEFALFGILDAADLAGESLLRRGEKRGFVKLTFDVSGIEYTVRRDLERTMVKGAEVVNQGKKCTLESGGVKNNYSPKELRVQVLRILGYSVVRYQNSKAIPLYRYTVYTPQEAVKEILWADAAGRFETLKEVFDIVKYETAVTNIKPVDDFLRARNDAAERQLAAIGDPAAELPGKEQARSVKETELKGIKGAMAQARRQKDACNADVDAAQAAQKDHAVQLEAILAKEKAISTNEDALAEKQEELAEAEGNVKSLAARIDALPKPPATISLAEDAVEAKIRAIRAESDRLGRESATWSKKLSDVEALLASGKCTLCGQAIHEHDRFEAELADARDKAAAVDKTLARNVADIKGLEAKKAEARVAADAKQKRDALDALLVKEKKTVASLAKDVASIGKRIADDRADIATALKKYNITDLQQFKTRGASLDDAARQAKASLTTAEAEVTRLERAESAGQQELKQLQAEIATLQANIQVKTALEQKAGYVKNVRSWLTGSLPGLVRDIERELLASTAQRFNEHFYEWFKLLVEDENIDVEIRPDDFQPVVTINGYESPFGDMSGGEKSALALAYRLALDKVIVEKYPDVKTRDLLILDEPTDGFSQEQVNRMQAVFQRLAMPQMIIISHERTLDSFVSDIFAFEKKNHETSVKRQ